jgi:hypothetical protein
MPRNVHYNPDDRPLFWIGVATVLLFGVSAVISMTRQSWVTAGVGAFVAVIGLLNARRHWKAMH